MDIAFPWLHLELTCVTLTSKNAVAPRDQKPPALKSSLASGLVTPLLRLNRSLSRGCSCGSTSTISLLVIAHYDDIRKYGIDRVLTPLLAEVAQLAQPGGFTFNVNGIYLPLRGAVIAVAADTPASNYMVGYKEGLGDALRKRIFSQGP